jgi:hypothetical protein
MQPSLDPDAEVLESEAVDIALDACRDDDRVHGAVCLPAAVFDGRDDAASGARVRGLDPGDVWIAKPCFRNCARANFAMLSSSAGGICESISTRATFDPSPL